MLTGCAPAVTLADNESNETSDAGFFRTPTTDNGSLSGTVFEGCDADGRPDEDESGVKGVTLTLTGPGGTRTAVPDAGGNYSFGDLLAGTYTLTEAQPAGFNQGINTPGTPPNGTVSGDTTSGIVVGGTALVGYNFGEQITSASLTISLTKTADKAVYAPGEMATYTYTVTNTSSVTEDGVVVADDNATPGFPYAGPGTKWSRSH